MKFEIFKKLFGRLFKPTKTKEIINYFGKKGLDFEDIPPDVVLEKYENLEMILKEIDEISADTVDLQKTYSRIKDDLLK